MSRLWVNANTIQGFLTKDPPEMAERSARLMAKAEMGEVSLYISPLVLAEVIWVLKSFYRHSMTAIAHVIISLVTAPAFEVDNRELSIRAVELARDRNVDFADAYLALQAPEHSGTVLHLRRERFQASAGRMDGARMGIFQGFPDPQFLAEHVRMRRPARSFAAYSFLRRRAREV